MMKRAIISMLSVVVTLSLAAVSQGAVVYQSDFTGTTLASAGLEKSSGAAGGSWAIDDPNDELDGVGGGNARASVYTSDSWQNDAGFTLDVTFWGSAALVRHSFGIVDADWTVPSQGDWLNESIAGAYGIGFSTAGSGPSDYLGFNNDAGTVTVLSTAQGDKTSAASETMSITVTATNWSYSLNGAAATTGSHTFDTTRNYRFIAYAQRASRAIFKNITLTSVPVVTVPTGLNPGDPYRLVFVSSTTRDATSTDIADYNAFVNTAAALNPDLDGISWTAIGSTLAVDAIDNTGTTGAGTGIGIYLLNDTAIATNYTDLWDSSLLTNVGIDESGNDLGLVNVWTGTSGSGTKTSSELGDTDGTVSWGKSDQTSSHWMRRLEIANTTTYSLYAISGVLTVPAVWDGSTDTDWSGASDATSWSGLTYVDGADAQFNGAGAGTVNITANVAPASISVNDGGANYTFADGGGVISGGSTLTKDGTGTLTINTANTYTGGTTLSNGTLIVGNNDAVGTGTLTLNGGTLRTGSTGATLTVPTVVSGTAAAFAGSANLGLAGAISGAGTLNVGGSGSGQGAGRRLDLAVNILNGFTGTLTLDNTENYIDIRGANTTAKLVTSGATSGQYIRLWGHSTFSELSGTGGYIAGDIRTLTINQNTDTVYGGHLGSVNGSRTLTLTKNGSGALTLTFANTYFGNTTVNGGTLLVNNASGSGTGTGAVTVNGTATLGGTGAISGLVTVNSTGHIAPGASIGTITMTGGLTLNNGSILDIEADAAGNADKILLTTGGTFTGATVADGVTLNVTFSGMPKQGAYTLIDWSDAGVTASGVDLADFNLVLTAPAEGIHQLVIANEQLLLTVVTGTVFMFR